MCLLKPDELHLKNAREGLKTALLLLHFGSLLHLSLWPFEPHLPAIGPAQLPAAGLQS